MDRQSSLWDKAAVHIQSLLQESRGGVSGWHRRLVQIAFELTPVALPKTFRDQFTFLVSAPTCRASRQLVAGTFATHHALLSVQMPGSPVPPRLAVVNGETSKALLLALWCIDGGMPSWPELQAAIDRNVSERISAVVKKTKSCLASSSVPSKRQCTAEYVKILTHFELDATVPLLTSPCVPVMHGTTV